VSDAAIKDAAREASRVIREVDPPLGSRVVDDEVVTVRALIAALHARGLDDLARAIEVHGDGIVNALVEEHRR